MAATRSQRAARRQPRGMGEGRRRVGQARRPHPGLGDAGVGGDGRGAGAATRDARARAGGGPGDTGFMAAELISPGGTLISSDGAEAMLEVARERARAAGRAQRRVPAARARMDRSGHGQRRRRAVPVGDHADRRSRVRGQRGPAHPALRRTGRFRRLGHRRPQPLGDDPQPGDDRAGTRPAAGSDAPGADVLAGRRRGAAGAAGGGRLRGRCRHAGRRAAPLRRAGTLRRGDDLHVADVQLRLRGADPDARPRPSPRSRLRPSRSWRPTARCCSPAARWLQAPVRDSGLAA